MDKADITCIQWNTTQPRESEVMPRAAAQTHLEMSILSNSERERQIHDITYMWNLKYDKMNLSTKQKQTHRHREQTRNCQGGGKVRGGMDWEVGVSRCKLYYT